MCRWLRSTGSSFTARRRFSPRIVEEPDQIEIMKDEIRTMKKIIKNGIVVTMNAAGDVWDHGYVMFEDTKILAAGPEDELEKTLQELTAQGILKAGETFEEIDAKRAIVIPGLVNTHCHLGMIPFRGLGDDCKDRLRVFLLPMENQAMDAEMARLSTRYAIGELLLSGVTTVLDMYYFEEVVAKVMDEMGIRGIAGETVMEKDSCDSKNADEAIEAGNRPDRGVQRSPACFRSDHAPRNDDLQPGDFKEGL